MSDIYYGLMLNLGSFASDLAPVVKATAAQAAARQILAMIRNGVWRPGDQLPTEKELIERLAVGRSTVREALQILATVNVVEATAGHGTYVRAPTAAGLFRPDLIAVLIGNTVALELLEAREMIEPPTVRLAAIRGTEAEFGRVDQILSAHAVAIASGRPVSEFAALFHIRLAQASQNSVAVSFMASILEMLMQRGRRFDHISDYQQRELDEHRAILALVRKRDADGAAEMMLRHIVESATTYDTAGMAKGEPLLA